MVGWKGGHPLLACEIKLRERVGAEGGMEGRGQLLSALEVARLRWPKVRGLLFNVSMASVLGLPDCRETPVEGGLPDMREGGDGRVILDGWAVGEAAVLRGRLSADALLSLGRLSDEAAHPNLVERRIILGGSVETPPVKFPASRLTGPDGGHQKPGSMGHKGPLSLRP